MSSKLNITRTLAGIALSALSAGLLLLALPPYGIWPLALVGMIPALVAQYRVLPRRINSLATAISLGGFLGIYILRLLPDFGTPWLKLVPVGIMALIYVTDQSVRAFNERTGYRWFVLQGALVWVGVEMIRSLIPSLGTGGFLAYAYAFAPWLIQPISIFGIFGLSLLTLISAYTLGLAAIALLDHSNLRPPWLAPEGAPPVSARVTRVWLTLTTVLAVAWTGMSLLLYRQADTATVRVAAIQPMPQPGASLFDQLAAQTQEATAQGAQVVVWPEGNLPYDPKVTNTPALKALAQETGATLVVGYGMRTPQGIRNEATVLTPEGQFLGVYGKDHPVAWLGETSQTRGTYPTYQTPLGKLGTIICYDLMFVDTARNMAAGGAQLIGVPSNDWPELSDKEYTHLVFRAVENRMALVKADTRYDSAIIDAYGRIIASQVTAQPSRTTLIANVSLGTADAPQIVLGDWMGWLSLAGLVLFSLPGALTRRLFER